MPEEFSHPDEEVGCIQFLPWAQGSKSDSKQPFLVQGPEKTWRLFHPGDNPFNNDFFKPLEGSWCRLVGKIDHASGVFKVDQATVLPDPGSESGVGEDGL